MNEFGRIFRINIFGESHGELVGVLIDGVPAGIEIHESEFAEDLTRRKGNGFGSTPRKESDLPLIKSGVFNGKSTGAPILIEFLNQNCESKDYEKFRDLPRPSHSDFVAFKKYNGFNDYRGGGHFSGRLTLGLVAAGVIAKKIISPISISANILDIGGAIDIESAIKSAVASGDSLGGIVECTANNIPIGLGEPYFDSLESLISHIIFSIPGVKGIEFGSGFRAAKMKGSEYNDAILDADGTTATNHDGGVNGGISNGNELIFRVAIKPTPSIAKTQNTLNLSSGKVEELNIQGRHDTAIALRTPVIIEAATAIALADFSMISNYYQR